MWARTGISSSRLFVTPTIVTSRSLNRINSVTALSVSRWSQGHLRTYSSSSTPPKAIKDATKTEEPSDLTKQLSRVAELKSRVAAENSKTGKQMIIAEYPDLRELLEYIYTPNLRTHLTYTSLQKYLYSGSQNIPERPPPTEILQLFDSLSKRYITGNEAKDNVWFLLMKNDILGNEKLMDTFGRLLDRNLVAGFGANTLKQVIWPKNSEVEETIDKLAIENTKSTSLSSEITSTELPKLPKAPYSTILNNVHGKTPIHPSNAKLDKFEVALGKSVEPPFNPLFKDHSNWYASRKLDGVRCLTFLDFLVPTSPELPLELVSVHFVSRTGKPFSSLSKLEDQLQHLSKLPNLRKWLDIDPIIIEERPEGVIKRLVLDGEICVMRPKTSEELQTSQERDDGSLADRMWILNDPYIEDFSSTVSSIKKSETIEHLSYFVFDLLSYSELNSKESLKGINGLGKSFSERVEDIRYLIGWLNNYLDTLDLEGEGNNEKILKDLKQVKVSNAKEVEGMVERAANSGWEGIMLRKDTGYKGKRSNDIRKFKKWSDSEYIVTSLDKSLMRLSINGVFDEYEAMSNVWIEHDGHPVSVGSGFTAEQRIKYGKNPGLIIGKMITVEYFRESDSIERNKKNGGKDIKKSLRFPRVKIIWEEGKRNI